MPTTSERPASVNGQLSPDLAIECIDLRKTYPLGEDLSLQRSIAALPLVPDRFRPTQMTVDALDRINFSVRRGEFFGIVGANGSGKSTLTQVISGIAVPTRGRARVRGRVLPLLEVGAGFHGELTGTENVYLLGAILDIPSEEIEEALPDIAAFAGVERHLGTPIKRYSSGMQARLSFGVAAHFAADIYIFDEVLAVVDDDFRERCADQMRGLNEQGRTIVFMSHDLDLVTSMCRTGMWLDKGRVREIGDMDDVARAYSQSHHAATDGVPPA